MAMPRVSGDGHLRARRSRAQDCTVLGSDAARGSTSPSRDAGGEARSIVAVHAHDRPRGIIGEEEALAPSCGQSLLLKPTSA